MPAEIEVPGRPGFGHSSWQPTVMVIFKCAATSAWTGVTADEISALRRETDWGLVIDARRRFRFHLQKRRWATVPRPQGDVESPILSLKTVMSGLQRIGRVHSRHPASATDATMSMGASRWNSRMALFPHKECESRTKFAQSSLAGRTADARWACTSSVRGTEFGESAGCVLYDARLRCQVTAARPGDRAAPAFDPPRCAEAVTRRKFRPALPVEQHGSESVGRQPQPEVVVAIVLELFLLLRLARTHVVPGCCS